MGYDIHITRADDWVESEEAPISAAEWTTFVDASSDLRWEAERPWAHMEVDLAIWTGHPDTEAEPWLALLNGQVETKNPDEPLRAKMYEIAAALGARIQGDEGELYGPNGEQLPDDQQTFWIAERESVERERAERKPLLSRLFERGPRHR